MQQRIVIGGYLVAGALGLWGSLTWADEGGAKGAAPAAPPVSLPAPLEERFVGLDKDGDGALTLAESGADAAAFRRADLDGNGRVSRAEAYRAHLVKSGQGLGKTRQVIEGFRKADGDGSGWLSEDELPPGSGYPFETLDRDGDGKLTLEEVVRYQVALEVADAMLDEDLDGDGKLSPDEVPAAARPLFSLGDRDRDGKLGEAEAYRLVVELRLASIRSRSEQPAAPRDGAQPSPAPESPGSARAPGEGRDVLSRLRAGLAELDRDGDGALSAAEAGVGRALFAALDRDRDGRLGAPELDLARGRARRLTTRAQSLAKRLGAAEAKARLAPLGAELQGLFMAGRLDAAEELLDEVELRLARAPR